MEEDIVLLEHYAYPTYGIPSKNTNAAICLCARLEGIITDPVYEGKSMQGMIDLVLREGRSNALRYLGGAPTLNGYSYAFRNG